MLRIVCFLGNCHARLVIYISFLFFNRTTETQRTRRKRVVYILFNMMIRKIFKFLVIFTLVFGMTNCHFIGIRSDNGKLPTVESLITPKLPDWIEQISPLGNAKPTSQIRIRFKQALIPVESLDSPQQQNLLTKFAIWPPLPGQFRFLTPRMVGFQADKAIPKATRVKVTLKAGLADLKNHRLNQDLAWTFNTESIQITNL